MKILQLAPYFYWSVFLYYNEIPKKAKAFLRGLFSSWFWKFMGTAPELAQV
jgi:hypothetical protein